MASTIQQFLKEHGISESKASFPTWPAWPAASSCAEKFAERRHAAARGDILQTVTGDYPEDQSAMNPSDIDIVLKADRKRCVSYPGPRNRPPRSFMTAFTATAAGHDGAALCARRVLAVRGARGNRWWPGALSSSWWPNVDSRLPPEATRGLLAARKIGRQAYSIAAVNEFDPLSTICIVLRNQDIEIDTLIHEAAPRSWKSICARLSMSLADQLSGSSAPPARRAMRHKMYATFMAKPMAKEPAAHAPASEASSTRRPAKHLQQSDGTPSGAVLRTYRRSAKDTCRGDVAVCANVNSYRRISRHSADPSTCIGATTIGTAGLRVPMSDPRHGASRTGSAAPSQSYLANSGLLAWVTGMVEGLKRP